MAQKHTIEQLKWRKHILEERTDRENYNIIKKINRNIAKLARERKYRGMRSSIPLHLFACDSYADEFPAKFYF